MKNINQIITALAIMVLSVYGQSCNVIDKNKIPDTAITAKIEEDSHGIIKLVDFNKTDGVESDVFGVKNYELEFTGSLAYQESCVQWSGITGALWLDYKSLNTKRMSEDFMGDARRADAGSKLAIKGKAVYVKKESGWNLTDLFVYVNK